MASSWLGCCFGDSGSEVDRAAQWAIIDDQPSPLPGMSGRTTLGPRGLAGPVLATGFGDLISVEGDCKVGELAVSQLLELFDKLGKPAKYAPAVAAIKKSYDDAESSWSRHIPFSPVCGEVKAIGVQADQLAKQMAAEKGAPIPTGATDQDPTGAVGKLIKGALVVAGIVAGGFVLREFKKGT